MVDQRTQLARELEWRACKKDPVYFLNKYWNIEIIGSGYEVAGLRPYQEVEVHNMQDACLGESPDRQVRTKARQVGWTTIADGFAFWNAWFHDHHPWLIAQQSEDEAKKTLLSKVKIPFLRLPSWMKDMGPTLESDNMTEMMFDNGSSITAVHSGSTAARGRAAYGVIMDEAAFMEDAESLFGALDPLCYGPMFVFSTANGISNWFFDIWQDSELPDSVWGRGFQPWSVVPGRDDAWYSKMKRRYRARLWLFYQEYPASPGEAFSKSGKTALPIALLEEPPHDWTAPEARYDLTMFDYEAVDSVRPFDVQLEEAYIEDDEERDLELHVWEWPTVIRDDMGVMVQTPNYTVSVDVAEGLDDGDFSGIVVRDANTRAQVATVKAHVPVEDLGAVSEWIGYWYHTALIGVERNNQGLVPLIYLQEHDYPRLFRMPGLAQQVRGTGRSTRYGYFTNKATKPKMVIDYTKALRDESIICRDPRFLAEARVFLFNGKGGYGAARGMHDDLTMAELISLQLTNEVGQSPTVYIDHAKRPITIGEVVALGLKKTEDRQISPLYQPLGQAPHAQAEIRSFEMMEQNLTPSPFRVDTQALETKE